MRGFGVIVLVGAAFAALAISASAEAPDKKANSAATEARRKQTNSEPAEARHKTAAKARHRKAKAKPQVFSAEATVKSDCMTCHTSGARTFLGYLPVPQIAGAPADYIEIQLKAYAEGRRQPDIWKAKYPNVHGGLSENQAKAVAEYVSSLPPAPHPDGAADLIEAGDKIFHNGAENDVPVCAMCHGDEAKGNGMFPRLAGQWRHYLIAKLLHMDRERGQGPNGAEDNSSIMKPFAKALTKEQILAVTAYVSSLK
jgi:cytochrome c553